MENTGKFETVREFFDFVGTKRLHSLGFSDQLLSRARNKNKIPTGWFIVLRTVCNDLGVLTPEHLFSWTDAKRAPSNTKQNVKSEIGFQGAAE